MEVRLKVLAGTNAGKELLIPGPKFFIGRAEDCHLRPRSDLISRHHCVILIEEDYVAIRDFGSKNGTFINSERVTGEMEVKSGDNVKVGPLDFEVSLVVPKKRSKVDSVAEVAARTAATAAADELDISQWLAPSEAGSATETRVIMSGETGEIDMAAETVSKMSEQSKTDSDRSLPAADKSKPGKLPPVPASKAADSRNAAADVLNKFFKRR